MVEAFGTLCVTKGVTVLGRNIIQHKVGISLPLLQNARNRSHRLKCSIKAMHFLLLCCQNNRVHMFANVYVYPRSCNG